MPQFFCSLPNVKRAGRIPCLISDDPGTIAAFVKRWDKPGHGVYRCINPLRPGATRRQIETIGAIERLPVDIDFKDLVAAPEEVERKLHDLPLPPSWVRRSGGGLHVGYELKEPVEATDAEYFQRACDLHKHLVAALSGDPAVAHPAALLRMEGSHNTKRGEPVLVETLWGTGQPVDLSEVEALIELLPAGGIFEKRRTGNGHDHHSPFEPGERVPVDIDERLAAMEFKGAGEAAVHTTQLAVSASMLRRGIGLGETVATVLDATRKAVAGNPACADWDWRQEEGDIALMCCSHIVKNPELADRLPEKWEARFREIAAAGERPHFAFRRDHGLYLRGLRAKEAADAGAAAASDSPPGTASGTKPRGWNYFDESQSQQPSWMVKGLLPETGVGILAGQWGSFKTTVALELSVSVMTTVPFAGQYKVKRRGAVLYFASEGAATVRSRLAALASHHGALDRLPFAWRSDCPVLTDKRAATILVDYIQDAAAYFKRSYELPVVLVWVDALITAAGFAPKEENDAAAVQKVMATLHVVSAQTGTFVAVIDHFGKVAETGTRGSSGKEGSADTVLATLADRELGGGITNSRLAARKQRDGISGFEVPFAPQTITLGLDEDGDPITAVVIDWSKSRSQPATPITPTLRLLLQVLIAASAAKGFPLQIEAGGPVVQVCRAEEVRKAFFEQYAVDGTKDQKGSRRRMAYRRAVTEATSRGLVGIRELNGHEIIWRREP